MLIDQLPRKLPVCVHSSLHDAAEAVGEPPADSAECLAVALDRLLRAADHLHGHGEGTRLLSEAVVMLLALQQRSAVGGE